MRYINSLFTLHYITLLTVYCMSTIVNKDFMFKAKRSHLWLIPTLTCP